MSTSDGRGSERPRSRPLIILDRVREWTLDRDTHGEFGNEIARLQAILHGLGFLASYIQSIQERLSAKYPGNPHVWGAVSDDMNDNFRTMYMFDWFAVSAMDYLSIVHYIQRSIDPSLAESAKDYRYAMYHGLALHRDKVGAHTVIASPAKEKRDDESERELSVMRRPVFRDGRLWMGAESLTGKPEPAVQSTSWSLTAAYSLIWTRFGFRSDDADHGLVSVASLPAHLGVSTSGPFSIGNHSTPSDTGHRGDSD